MPSGEINDGNSSRSLLPISATLQQAGLVPRALVVAFPVDPPGSTAPSQSQAEIQRELLRQQDRERRVREQARVPSAQREAEKNKIMKLFKEDHDKTL